MSSHYDEAHDAAIIALKSNDFSTAGNWPSVIKSLKKLVSIEGFESSHSGATSDIRTLVAKGAKATMKASNTIFAGAGLTAMPTNTSTLVPDSLAARVATLEMARRLHLLKKFGSHKVWVLSLPAAYADWPCVDLKGTISAISAKLNDDTERFSAADKKNLSNATQEGLKWVHKAMIVCGAPKTKKHMELLKRWFGDEDTTEATLLANASMLNAGWKKISKTMKSGHLILTDNPGDRGGGLEESEAYAWGDKRDVIYIEAAFFDYGKTQMLQGLTHWTRILVHEMTHRDCNTADVPGRYAWGGIKPTKGSFGNALAITNADSWAWFAADCAGALTQANRDAALK